MKLAELPRHEQHRRLRRGTLTLRTGPFLTRVRTIVPEVMDGIALMYADYPVVGDPEFADFHVAVMPPRGARRWFRPKVYFVMDGRQPFQPLPRGQAFAMFEWGLNWCVSTVAHQYLMIHAAVVERGGRVCLLPAPPGSGKSTLCAALVNRGWRLLSDEMALVRPADVAVVPQPRPVSLKNDSIDIMGAFAPRAVIGRRAHDTGKGTVAHMRAPPESVERSREDARPGWVVFPRYVANAPARLEPRSPGSAFMFLAENAFNYSILGLSGFRTLSRLIETSACFDFSYGSLDEAMEVFDGLATGDSAPPGAGQ